MANYLTTDADLTSVANAIRTKGGTSAQLAFPAGFVSAVEAIPSSSGYTVDQIMGRTASGDMVYTLSSAPKQWLDGFAYITSFSAPNLTAAFNHNYCFRNCTRLAHVSFPKLSNIYGAQWFAGTAIKTLVFPMGGSTSATRVQIGGSFVNGANSLTAIDSYSISIIGGAGLQNAPMLSTIIIRHISPQSNKITTLDNVNAFNNTPFASGNSGGTIYIPKTLYDHLGDGSSLDFKAATNWSTIDGYGTITWAQIEGSIYETQYADGTPIT